uniref:Potassium channel domain-containing protein n=1 Tax=Trichuris muris TaxID=70415 RepID=A0A5S6QRI6_TRIMR
MPSSAQSEAAPDVYVEALSALAAFALPSRAPLRRIVASELSLNSYRFDALNGRTSWGRKVRMTLSGKMPPEEADWSFMHSVFKVFLLLIVLLSFLLCGGCLFQHLEQEVTLEHFYSANVELERHKADLLKSLWAHALVLGEDDWNQIATERIEFYERQVGRLTENVGPRNADWRETPWSFMDSLFYTFTLVTTIGFGDISPRTGGGKLATVVYGLVGIPIILTLLDEIGKLLAKTFRRAFGIDDAKLSLALLLTVLSTGTLFFAYLEGLDWLDACYFSFVTFSSVGFGDIVPVRHRNFLFSLLYIVACLALLSVSLSFWKNYVNWSADALLAKLLRKRPDRSSQWQHPAAEEARNMNASRIPEYNQPPNMNSDMPYRRSGRKVTDESNALDSINEE